MPIFFQHQINENTRIGIWKIEETEEFFKGNVPLHRDVTHPHKRLQHLAGRFLLQYLFPDFPFELIQIADTRKPFIPSEQYHFSISHCGDYAAAIVSRENRVGIDIEESQEKIGSILYKFLNADEHQLFNVIPFHSDLLPLATLLWSAKEAVFKWYGNGGVDFRRHIKLVYNNTAIQTMDCLFLKEEQKLIINYRQFPEICLTWVFN